MHVCEHIIKLSCHLPASGSEDFLTLSNHCYRSTLYPFLNGRSDAKNRENSVADIIECVACSEVRPVIWILISACGHSYCFSCVPNLCTICTSDEQFFPPRCCRHPMDLEKGKAHLPRPTQILFDQKALEYTTPNRTFCCNPHCSTFVPPKNYQRDRAVCPKCRTATCTICKNNGHPRDCPQDTATQQLREVARAEGWRQCRMV